MLKKILFLLTLLLVTLSLVTFAKAAITNSSRVIPYQGRLTDSSGNNVADSTYAMTFKIYTVSSGGSAAFTETFSAGNAVTVSSGLFSVLLGSLSANGVNLDFANPPYYLGITVASNSEMTPRIQIGFTALAHNSQYLDGTPLSSFQLNTGVITGAAGTNTRLQATGTGTGSTGNGSIYFLNSSGTTKGRFDTTDGITSATGGTITASGGYTIHTFTSSGTFTPASAGNVEYLVVAGGGGGGGQAGGGVGRGGGGAGGFRTASGFAVTGQGYTVTVGAGGAGGVGSANGSPGENSVFSTIIATGGGYGAGSGNTVPGGDGGSGGGGMYNASAGGAGTSGQGSNGGAGTSSATNYGAGGGGGASAVGAAGTSTTGGNGGAGTASSISGSSVTYAGGGGGGTYNGGTVGAGGAGGGGAGATGAVGVSGTANTGGGGGGSGGNTAGDGGAGGSGIVIIRYPTYGTMYLGAINTSSADLAEYYVSGDKSLSAGDVVAIAPDNNSKGVLLKSNKSYDSKLVGVISTNPGVVLGSIDGDTGKSDKRQLALAGRVPVKIDPASDPIEVGDFLTSSDKPGFAKKATESGYVIGKALENWSGQSSIEVFINLIYSDTGSQLLRIQKLEKTNDILLERIKRLENLIQL